MDEGSTVQESERDLSIFRSKYRGSMIYVASVLPRAVLMGPVEQSIICLEVLVSCVSPEGKLS